MRGALVLQLLLVACFAAQPVFAQFMQLDEQIKPAAKGEPGATPCEIWMEPNGPKKGVLVAVHGLGLHKGCYKDFAGRMTKLGWAVYAVDVRGFGNFMKMEKGARKVDFPGCMSDVQDALKFVREVHPGMPVFLVGESMGGGIALQCASKYSDLVNGVITACPASKRHKSGSAAIRVAGGLLTGKKSMDIKPILVEQSTQKEDLRQAWLHDPEGRFEMAPVELIEFQLFMDHNVHAARELKKPIFILQGKADALVKAEAQEELLAAVPHGDKNLLYVDQQEHLILEENQFNDQIILMVSMWLDQHLPKQAASKI